MANNVPNPKHHNQHSAKWLKQIKNANGHPVMWPRPSNPSTIKTRLRSLNQNVLDFDIQPTSDPRMFTVAYNPKPAPNPITTTSWKITVTINSDGTCTIEDPNLDIKVNSDRISDSILLYADAVLPTTKPEDIRAAINMSEGR